MKLSDISLATLYLYYLVIVSTVCRAFWVGGRIGFRQQQYLPYYLLFTLCSDICTITILKSTTYQSNFYLFYFVMTLHYYSWYFYREMAGNYRIVILSLTVLADLMICYWLDTDTFHYQTQMRWIIAVYHILLPLLWFHYKFNYDLEKQITAHPSFWISTGLLMWATFYIYRPHSFAYTGFDETFMEIMTILNILISTLMYSLYFVALNKYRQYETPRM